MQLNCQYIPLELLSSSSSGKVSLGSDSIPITMFPQEPCSFPPSQTQNALLWLLRGPEERREASRRATWTKRWKAWGKTSYWSQGLDDSLLGSRVCAPFPHCSSPNPILWFFLSLPSPHLSLSQGLELTELHLCLLPKC